MKSRFRRQQPVKTPIRRISNVIYRIVSISFFCMGLYYWVRLAGVYNQPFWRFDLMPTSWRAAASTLAVLYPVAGLGLWLAGSWGGVLWALVAALEWGLVIFMPQLFGGGFWVAVCHACGLALVILLRIADFFLRRRRQKTVRDELVTA